MINMKVDDTMTLQSTPRADRVHIGVFGLRNSGKSSLVNALTGQEVAIVSDVAGTTTDPVYKSMEVHGLGPCVFIDTAGFDDEGVIGDLRIEKSLKVIDKTDIAIIVLNLSPSAVQTAPLNQSLSAVQADTVNHFASGNRLMSMPGLKSEEINWLNSLKSKKTPIVGVLNKIDLYQAESWKEFARKVEQDYEIPVIPVSAVTGQGIDALREQLIRSLPASFESGSITGNLVKEGDVVLLVMPQDIQAPKGRLILPQVQVIRELLDKKCVVQCVTTDKLEAGLAALSQAPQLIITDSQVFRTVYDKKPQESLLTSFSVLLAGCKGDLKYFAESAYAIERLTENSKVLIAEACTHAPLEEDVGRVKIPAMLRRRIGSGLKVDVVGGTDFPEELRNYDLIIHCGACMFNKKHVLTRVEKARAAGIPMSNYGVTIAYLSGILKDISLPE